MVVMASNSYSPQILEKIKSIKKVRKKCKIGIPGKMPRKYRKSTGPTPGDVEQSGESAEKVRKKCRGNTGNATKCRKSAEKIQKQSKKYKNMNTKGAGAEGACPLCGAAEGRPSYF